MATYTDVDVLLSQVIIDDRKSAQSLLKAQYDKLVAIRARMDYAVQYAEEIDLLDNTYSTAATASAEAALYRDYLVKRTDFLAMRNAIDTIIAAYASSGLV